MTVSENEVSLTQPNGTHTPRRRSIRPEIVSANGADNLTIRREATKALIAERESYLKRIAAIDAELGIPVKAMAIENLDAPVKPMTMRAPKRAAKPASHRLPRRSAEAIAESLQTVVELLKEFPDGLRAEEIRGKLELEAKAMPRIMKLGLETLAIRCSGTKRATTYFAL